MKNRRENAIGCSTALQGEQESREGVHLYTNLLINEKSPYLLQHAHNPVRWYPWGEEAFKKAKEEDKPIFLSIGYSTCHWCHVMAHESFEDPVIADMMNDAFINIKVDREERPDLDNIYMLVCQAMTGSGGWPLNLVLTPDKKPFFAGTYFPKESHWRRMGMMDLIPRISRLWRERREEICQTAITLKEKISQMSIIPVGKELGEDVLRRAFEEMRENFDFMKGGSAGSPKFPTPHNYRFLLRYWKRTGNRDAVVMVEKTLTEMRKGGIFDHVGGGFHRYSTDSQWLVPHFEKMLYDQAMLALLYGEAYGLTGKEEYKETAEEILEYVLRDLRSDEGGFFSAEDADSEGEEGKFYLWEYDEIMEILGEEEGKALAQTYNVEKEGNFRDEALKRYTGKNILYLKNSGNKLRDSLKKLFEVRNKRIRPLRDDKILTDWNGLIISALSLCGRLFNRPDYIRAAQDSVHFVLENMRLPDGRLIHSGRADKRGDKSIPVLDRKPRHTALVSGSIQDLVQVIPKQACPELVSRVRNDGGTECVPPGFVDDYAFFIRGLLDLYYGTFDNKYLRIADELQQKQIDLFLDLERGGFFFTAKDGETLMIRQKEIYDGALPSGNSVSAFNLLHLSILTGNTNYMREARRIERAFYNQVIKNPSAYTQLLTAVDFAISDYKKVVIRKKADEKGEDVVNSFGGGDEDKGIVRWDFLRSSFNPYLLVLMVDEEADMGEEGIHSVGIEGMAVYVCTSGGCLPPAFTAEDLKERLQSTVEPLF